jgi:hypothetical protein
MGLLFVLFISVFIEDGLSKEWRKEYIECTMSQTGKEISLEIDWERLRSLRILNGADYFDARLENNAIRFELRSNSQVITHISQNDGFSYYDKDLHSVVIGITNEEYKDILNLEIFLQSHNTFNGKFYLKNEVHSLRELQEVNCKKKP